jgi:hypothetical protein
VFSPLRAKFTPRVKLHPWGQTHVVNNLLLHTHLSPDCRKGERKPTDPEERLSEEEVHILEAFLEEAHASGAGQLSTEAGF